MMMAEPVRAETVGVTALLSRAVVVECLSCCQDSILTSGEMRNKWIILFLLLPWPSWRVPPIDRLNTESRRWETLVMQSSTMRTLWAQSRMDRGRDHGPNKETSTMCIDSRTLVFSGAWQEGWSDVTHHRNAYTFLFLRDILNKSWEIERICGQIDCNSEFQRAGNVAY